MKKLIGQTSDGNKLKFFAHHGEHSTKKSGRKDRTFRLPKTISTSVNTKNQYKSLTSRNINDPITEDNTLADSASQ